MSENKNLAVAVYESHRQAEEAIEELNKAKFNIKQLSIVGKDYHSEENVVGYYNTGDRMKAWGKFGAFWGGLWGLLIGAAFFTIPGIGPILVGGHLVAVILSVLEGAIVVGGLSVLGAGLFSLGIPKDSVLQYESDLKAGKYVIIAHGTMDEVNRAKEILSATATKQIDVYPLKDRTVNTGATISN